MKNIYKYIVPLFVSIILPIFANTNSASASTIAITNNQLFVKNVGWQSFSSNGELGVSANRWITGQRGVIALPANTVGSYYSGQFDFITRFQYGSGYYDGDSSNVQCFATQDGTLWNAIGNKSFSVDGFSITNEVGQLGSYNGFWRIKGSFSGQSVSNISSRNNFACEFWLNDNKLIFQVDGSSRNFASGVGNFNSSIVVSFADNPSDAIVNLQSALTAQNQTIITQNDVIINQNQATQNIIKEQSDWLQDTTPPSVDTSSLGSAAGWLPQGPVDSILTLPLQLLQGIVNVFTNTNCAPLVVPVPFVNENITLPCVSTLMDDIGFTPIWGLVGGVISAVIIWNTLKWLYKFVDDTLTFRENNSGLWGGL